ncbi:thiamine biosynthesis protein ThiF [Sphingomonas sp. Leaf407]|uniref:HesA/MoeB/ThiF family protein n=1 Tax=unclassified Sphingomonas TaxID=196159 RepID=UPI0006F1CE79|nr:MULTISPECIES: ThiF family adenylyltransferase [unclassified Sphingomonas]KQN40265.1 thiamine biosynthesis protein ThiF [Sphingomonas sp. Leaf42]KQT29619.1 thiamine biosynthesis protein ThiF [Sphingomonas sp. Leaf407]
MTGFDYGEMTTRNRGFVSEAEQARLRAACVLIPGVGGMGGAAFMALVRAGVGRFVIADIDTFEVSNLNRQLFATLDTVGMGKAAAARDGALRINPQAEIEVLGGEWPHALDRLVAMADVIVNGMDDAAAGVHLYRRAQAGGRTVIDAYASPLPSVTVVRPDAPRPEVRLRYPTVGVAWTEIDADMRVACLQREIEYVLTHSSSHAHVDLGVAAEVAAGKRSRFSFATMVTMAGTMMAEEAIRVILGRAGGTDHRGYFLNPHRVRIERPLPAPIAAVRGIVVRRFLRRMMA